MTVRRQNQTIATLRSAVDGRHCCSTSLPRLECCLTSQANSTGSWPRPATARTLYVRRARDSIVAAICLWELLSLTPGCIIDLIGRDSAAADCSAGSSPPPPPPVTAPTRPGLQRSQLLILSSALRFPPPGKAGPRLSRCDDTSRDSQSVVSGRRRRWRCAWSIASWCATLTVDVRRAHLSSSCPH